MASMTTGPKVALAALGALALYLVFGSKPAAAAPGTPAQPPAPGTILPVPTPPALPPPSAIGTDEAAVFVVITRKDALAPQWGPVQVATIPKANATNPGYLVDQVNHAPLVTPPPDVTEAVQVFTTDSAGKVLYAFAFQGGTTVTPANNLQYGLVGYDGSLAPAATFVLASQAPDAKVIASYTNGSSDRSVQRAAALNAKTAGNFASVVVYDLVSGNIDVDSSGQGVIV